MTQQAVGGKTELLNVLGDVKARIQDKLGILDFPLPQFILIGKQSVGKSRLIEALAGETFNFISGTLGSRRPTVLEFRNVPTIEKGGSRWYVRNRETSQWEQHPVSEVKKIVGQAHEELGASVSTKPIDVRMESPDCVDLQIVDLPGFREFSMTEEHKSLADQIVTLVTAFMRDERNVMLCVEQAGDAATMSTLARCKELDPNFKRTVLIRNKLDKYYKDLSPEMAEKWVAGFGDIPESLEKFALTLPFWADGAEDCPTDFVKLREQKNQEDVQNMSDMQISAKAMKGIGFDNFASYVEVKIQDMFVKAIDPVMDELKGMQAENTKREKSLVEQYEGTDPSNVVRTTHECGKAFGQALNFFMEGALNTEAGKLTLKDELIVFSEFIKKAYPTNPVECVPSEDFCDIEDYIEYLLDEAGVGHKDEGEEIPLHGGAQWRRMISEVEIFLRFSEIGLTIKKKDVIQARGVAMTNLTWKDVVRKLLGNEAHLPLERRVRYVGERVKWFFLHQREAVLDFMCSLEDGGHGQYSRELPKYGRMIKNDEMIKHMIWDKYEKAVSRQCESFLELFNNMLTSTFSNPWVFLKGATATDVLASDFKVEDPKERIPDELKSRSGVDRNLNQWLLNIPTEPHEIDRAVELVSQLVLKTFGFIRAQVCDQVEIVCESFFKLPMLRRLNDDMNDIQLLDEDKMKFETKRKLIDDQKNETSATLKEVTWCISRLNEFKVNTLARNPGSF